MRNNATEKLLSTARAEGLSITENGFAEFMDRTDPLHEHREAFHFPKRRDGGDYVYVSGNTLGLQHKDVESNVGGVLKKWRDLGVMGNYQHPNPWEELESLGRKEIAAIVGAQESEVITMNSFGVNLHLLLMAFYRPKGKRRRIVTGNHASPSSTYAIISQLDSRGMNPAEDLIYVSAAQHESWESSPVNIPIEQFLSVIEKRGDEIAVILMSAVHFLTGQFYDLQTITKAAHEKGIFVGVDCSHAVGNVPLKLHDWEVDFACWCNYRYLNSGPSNLGGAFVHSKHTSVENELKPLRGSWGHDRRNRASLHHNFEPAEGAASFQISNVSAVGMMAMLPSIRLMAEVGMGPLREKSMLLTSYMELLLSELVPQGSIEVITPVDPNQRGAQLSLRILPNRLADVHSLKDAYECNSGEDSDADRMERQLCDKGVIVSHCPPNVIRLAPVPLYNSFMDVLLTVRAIAECF
ncbi:kynureninase, putative [Trypanosoma cruzi]|uniref:Kynureninase n=2 Tax=Trypanosoma cruzi TaxID=5693 RepID=V5DAK6_TRYCR|nr:kynureninase, putative [Trypanosoma cruzi]ESS64486.1 kynureninase [Trypanosoma cruzi Dm28c]PBJ74805.1 kynureninase [Trypanosoma cruzi cruzi]KAF8280363.1 putative kynureninase [Trypanosoma cruzi]PBJ80089.1 kynureninase [Trypanosoma cruzi cruzi]